MKANAPKKLYLNWTEYPLEEIQVEYTRTDAFIEKACEFLNSSSILKDSGIVEKFKIYMKGE